MPARTERSPRRPRELHDAARAAVLHIVEREGLGAFTLRAVAERLGVTHVALYRHFDDKEELLASVAEQGFHLLRDELAAAAATASGDPVEQLHRLGLAYVEFADRRRGHFRLMYARELAHRWAHVGLEAAAGEAFFLLRDVVSAGQRAGRICRGRPTALAIAAWSMVHGLAVLIGDGQFDGIELPSSEIVAAATARLRAGLLAPTEKRAPSTRH